MSGLNAFRKVQRKNWIADGPAAPRSLFRPANEAPFGRWVEARAKDRDGDDFLLPMPVMRTDDGWRSPAGLLHVEIVSWRHRAW